MTNHPKDRNASRLPCLVFLIAATFLISCWAIVLPLRAQEAAGSEAGSVLPDGSGRLVAGLKIDRSQAPGGNRFLGSEGCRPCHQTEYDGWVKTFHSTAVQDAKDNPAAILADFSAQDLPFTRDEVQYTIGSHWDQRYMKEIDGEYYVLPRLWAVQDKEWRPYSVWSWKKKPYSVYCAGCHTTYIDPVRRTIGDDGIGCEACHGPGGLHADAEGDPSVIVNPSDLSIERYNMICATCHVRGMDKSGQYYYPVGYLPGEDLTEYYVPIEMKEGKTVRGAISRIFRDWKNEKENSARARCEVCGIVGTDSPPKEVKDDIMEFCFGCHNFRAKMQLHTHHPSNVSQTCSDCHIPRAKDLKEGGLKGDIHSYSYFMVHNENCYDKEIEKACVKCHGSKPDALNWARDEILSWKKRIIIDH